MTRLLGRLALILASLSIAAGAFLSGLAGLGAAVLGIGGLWLIGLLFGWGWIAAPGLFLLVGAAAAAFFFTAPPVGGIALLFGGGVLALVAWDLTDFDRRLRLAEAADRPGLERTHFSRLGIVAGSGVFLLVLASSLEIELNFEWFALLILIGAVSLRSLIGKVFGEK